MFANNVKHVFEFVYNIQFAEGKWFAWYYETTNLKALSVDTNGAN